MLRLPTWAWWTLGIAAAGGVGYLALRPSRVAATPQLPPQYPDPLLPKTRAPMDLASPSIPGPMPGPDGFTDFFTPESEKLISSALESWRMDESISDCTIVEIWDDQSQSMAMDYLEEARSATVDVLNQHYPLDGGKAWTSDPAGRPDWATWLFARVEVMAEKIVCGFGNVT